MSIVFKLTCFALILVSMMAVGCGSGANQADLTDLDSTQSDSTQNKPTGAQSHV